MGLKRRETTPPQDELRTRLDQGCRLLGVAPEDRQKERLLALIGLLVRWGRAYNLTAVREPLRMVSYHLLDSLALAPFLQGTELLDVGTGAGFPGLPLAILHPHRRFVLLDSNGKKIRFVRQAVLELGLSNVRPLQSRIESYPRDEKFATIVTRAFAPLSAILRLTSPLLQPSGVLLAAKGPRAGPELAELESTAADCRLHRLQIPFLEAERTLVEIRPGRVSSTSTKQR